MNNRSQAVDSASYSFYYLYFDHIVLHIADGFP